MNEVASLIKSVETLTTLLSDKEDECLRLAEQVEQLSESSAQETQYEEDLTEALELVRITSLRNEELDTLQDTAIKQILVLEHDVNVLKAERVDLQKEARDTKQRGDAALRVQFNHQTAMFKHVDRELTTLSMTAPSNTLTHVLKYLRKGELELLRPDPEHMDMFEVISMVNPYTTSYKKSVYRMAILAILGIKSRMDVFTELMNRFPKGHEYYTYAWQKLGSFSATTHTTRRPRT